MKASCVLLTGAFALSGMTLAGCDRPAETLPVPAQQSSNPLTAKVDLPRDFAAALDGWVLRLEGVTFRGRQHKGLRLFLNKPDATAETPLSDPSYLGSVSPGHYDENWVSTNDFMIELRTVHEPAKKLLREASRIEITGVPLVRDPGTAPAVTFGKIQLVPSKSLE